MSTTVVRTPTSRVRLGHARVDITPPVGIYHRLWGAARHDRATGVHRPLYADLLAIGASNGQGPSLMRGGLDLAGLVQAQQDAVIRAAAEGTGVAPEQVVLTHSHTHSSGWFVPDRVAFPGGELILPYIDALVEKVRGAAGRPRHRLARVTGSYAA
jgi:hypothetical protein